MKSERLSACWFFLSKPSDIFLTLGTMRSVLVSLTPHLFHLAGLFFFTSRRSELSSSLLCRRWLTPVLLVWSVQCSVIVWHKEGSRCRPDEKCIMFLTFYWCGLSVSQPGAGPIAGLNDMAPSFYVVMWYTGTPSIAHKPRSTSAHAGRK